MKSFWERHSEDIIGIGMLLGLLAVIIAAAIYAEPAVNWASLKLFGITFSELTAPPPAPAEFTPDCQLVHVTLTDRQFYADLCTMPGGQTECIFARTKDDENVCYPKAGVNR